MVHHDRCHGVLYLDAASPHCFTADDLEVLTGFANQAAVAIGHAELTEQVKQLEAEQRRRVQNLGFTEAFRARTHGGGHYSFWDYQAGAFDKNDGIRIDHFLLTPQCADLLSDCWIEKDLRAREKPSDHVPVWIDLAA